jgi:hypothetical protein
MKTVFTIETYESTTLIGNILNMVGNHNAGKAVLSLSVLQGYLKAFAAQYPLLMENCTIYENAGLTLALMDEKENIRFVITEKQLYDLDVPFPEVEPVNEIAARVFPDLNNHSHLINEIS